MRYPIKGFQLSSLIEWEGHITSVVFLGGCNFRCGFCHNHTLIDSKKSGETIPLDTILDRLEEQRGWVDAVAVTGGEPTCCSELGQLVKEFKKRGLQVQIETNGSDPEKIKSLTNQGLVDYIAMDFKAPLDDRHQILTGVKANMAAIRESIDYLLTMCLDYEFRTTVVPTLHDESTLIEMAKVVCSAKRYFIQRFNNKNLLSSKWSSIEPYSDREMNHFAQAMQKHCPAVRFRSAYSRIS